jgi:hypothetical protein
LTNELEREALRFKSSPLGQALLRGDPLPAELDALIGASARAL